jgi:hypothetical protein
MSFKAFDGRMCGITVGDCVLCGEVGKREEKKRDEKEGRF